MAFFVCCRYVFTSNLADLTVQGDSQTFQLRCNDPDWKVSNAKIQCQNQHSKDETIELLDDGGSSHAYREIQLTPDKAWTVSVKFWLLEDGVCEEENKQRGFHDCSPSVALCRGPYDPEFASTGECYTTLSPFNFEAACQKNTLNVKPPAFIVAPKYNVQGEEINRGTGRNDTEECAKLTTMVALGCSFDLPVRVTQEIVEKQTFFLSFWVSCITSLHTAQLNRPPYGLFAMHSECKLI